MGHPSPGPVKRAESLATGKGSRNSGALGQGSWRPEESVLERHSFQLVEGPGLQALSERFGGHQEESSFPGRRMAALPADSETCSGLQTQPCPCWALPGGGGGGGPPVPHILLLGEQPLKPGSPDRSQSVTHWLSGLPVSLLLCLLVGCHEQSPGCGEDGRSLFGSASLAVFAGISNTAFPRPPPSGVPTPLPPLPPA